MWCEELGKVLPEPVCNICSVSWRQVASDSQLWEKHLAVLQSLKGDLESFVCGGSRFRIWE